MYKNLGLVVAAAAAAAVIAAVVIVKIRRRRAELPELNQHPERLEQMLDPTDDA